MFKSRYAIHIVLILACLAIVFGPRLYQVPATEKAEAATVSATSFLALVDADQFSASWDVAAALMREKMSAAEWVENLTAIRERYGAIIDRKQENASYSTEAKDSPAGEYITLTFASNFKQHQGAIESVIVMLDGDGSWKVAGYFVK
jgi:hypothetical protein